MELLEWIRYVIQYHTTIDQRLGCNLIAIQNNCMFLQHDTDHHIYMDILFCKKALIIKTQKVKTEWLEWFYSIGGISVTPTVFRISYKTCHQWYCYFIVLLSNLETHYQEKHLPLLIVSYLTIPTILSSDN